MDKLCTTCNERKSHTCFDFAKTVCRDCQVYHCSGCREDKTWMNFSLKQMNKGDLRKCRVCTGQPMATLLCEMCEKNLNLSCFKKESRAPPVCNECLLEEQLEEASTFLMGNGIHWLGWMMEVVSISQYILLLKVLYIILIIVNEVHHSIYKERPKNKIWG